MVPSKALPSFREAGDKASSTSRPTEGGVFEQNACHAQGIRDKSPLTHKRPSRQRGIYHGRYPKANAKTAREKRKSRSQPMLRLVGIRGSESLDEARRQSRRGT